MDTNTLARCDASPFAANAARYLEKGFVVVPIIPGQKCPGEHDGQQWRPMPGWQENTLDSVDERLESWESWPDAGIGVLLGQKSGLVAIDVDTDRVDILEAIAAALPGSLVKKRGRKGYTAFYRYSGEITRKWSIGGECVLELHSDGKQTVLPPSIHPGTGEPYRWITEDALESIDRDELTTLPSDTCERLEAALAPFGAGSRGSVGTGDLGPEVLPHTVSARTIDDLRAALAYIPADEYSVWIDVGMALKSTSETGFELWREWSATSSKYDAEAARTLQRKWAGFAVRANGLSYPTVFHLAKQHGYKSVAPAKPEIVELVIRPGPKGNLARAQAAHEAANDPAGWTKRHGGQQLLRASELGDLAPPDWLIKGIQVSDSLCMTYGPAGGGKSFHALDKCLHIAAGIPFHDRQVKQGTVVYIAGEGRVGIAKRVRAWCEFHEVDIDSLPFYVTIKPVPFLDPRPVEAILELIGALPDESIYVCIDTLNRNFGDGDENSTKDMSAFVDALDMLRQKTGACVEVVHHTGKGEATTARGNSALRAALDTEISIKPTDSGKGIRIVCTKQKDAEPFPEIVFELREIELGEIDGEKVTSLVPVPDQVSEATAAMLDGHKQGLTKARSALLDVLAEFWRKLHDPDDERKRLRFDHQEFINQLKAEPYNVPKQTASRARDWAVEHRLITWPNALQLEIGPAFKPPSEQSHL